MKNFYIRNIKGNRDSRKQSVRKFKNSSQYWEATSKEVGK